MEAVEPLGSRALRAYAFVYTAVAFDLERWWPHGSPSPGSRRHQTREAALTLWELPYPPGEPKQQSSAPTGYSRRHDALWLRPHRLLKPRDANLRRLLSQNELPDVQQLFYEGRTLVSKLRGMTLPLSDSLVSMPGPAAPHLFPSGIPVRDVLSADQLSRYRRIAGLHSALTLKHRGVLLVGHDPRSDPGIFWVGVRCLPELARHPEQVQARWLREHPDYVVRAPASPVTKLESLPGASTSPVYWPEDFTSGLVADLEHALQSSRCAQQRVLFGSATFIPFPANDAGDLPQTDGRVVLVTYRSMADATLDLGQRLLKASASRVQQWVIMDYARLDWELSFGCPWVWPLHDRTQPDEKRGEVLLAQARIFRERGDQDRARRALATALHRPRGFSRAIIAELRTTLEQLKEEVR